MFVYGHLALAVFIEPWSRGGFLGIDLYNNGWGMSLCWTLTCAGPCRDVCLRVLRLLFFFTGQCL